jgi:hypothetical protein
MPLTAFALVLGVVLLGIAVVAAVFAAPFPFIAWPAGMGLLFVIGTIFERVRYKDVAPTPPLGPGWMETQERFRDPATNRWVQVYFKPETGERSYVDIPPPTP